MFTVSDGNVLTRQAGTIIVAIIMYLELLALLYISQRIKKRINTRLVKVVFLFMLFPIFSKRFRTVAAERQAPVAGIFVLYVHGFPCA